MERYFLRRHTTPAAAAPSPQPHAPGQPFPTATPPSRPRGVRVCACARAPLLAGRVSRWPWLLSGSWLVLGAGQGDPCPPGARRPTKEARPRQSPCCAKMLSPAGSRVGPRALVLVTPKGLAALACSMPRAWSLRVAPTHASSGGGARTCGRLSQPPRRGTRLWGCRGGRCSQPPPSGPCRLLPGSTLLTTSWDRVA